MKQHTCSFRSLRHPPPWPEIHRPCPPSRTTHVLTPPAQTGKNLSRTTGQRQEKQTRRNEISRAKCFK
ncbi:hypothetical protein BDU57DRAFT_519823 [Ampelomyces quisqualis]|uniref:Uncharacterized protein n=1 Tax=Ampelomyces quisqualis TaxID=50730 RepID=A0A6A5QKT4_AMPQU|nr:hypothetical protein BDU57DRAFT_519823 [Ampelomyces quisqualis]